MQVEVVELFYQDARGFKESFEDGNVTMWCLSLQLKCCAFVELLVLSILGMDHKEET